MWLAAALVLCASSLALGQVSPIGGSTDSCGYTRGSVSGGFATAAHCQPTLCCSSEGSCGPEPTITSDPTDAYCGDGCQAEYGSCSRPEPAYFEYIGVGLKPGEGTDTTQEPATVAAIPVPAAGSLRFIVFLLSDQPGPPPADGTSTGSFDPVGQYAAGGTGTASFWEPDQIGNLTARGKVMASIGGDASATVWRGADTASYVPAALDSLLGYYNNFSLDGFDIDYEAILPGEPYKDWLSAWSQILTQLKATTVSSANGYNGATVSFAPYSATQQAYRDLQNAMAALGSHVDYIIYQLYAENDKSIAGLTSKLESLQSFYAPAKIIAGLSPDMLTANSDLVEQLKQSASNFTSGFSVFAADQSQQSSPPFELERQLWGSSTI